MVTGASQGIGRATAQMLADAGADIVVNHFGAPAADVEELSRSIRQLGRRVIAIEADVSNRTEVAKMVELAMGEFGRLDILVNNAGIAPERPIESTTEEIWDRVLAVNLRASSCCARRWSRTCGREVTGGSSTLRQNRA
jgi:NAD(P)-dependent dehydrogenase (short-subunit alcohol dehydrogenase family)